MNKKLKDEDIVFMGAIAFILLVIIIMQMKSPIF